MKLSHLNALRAVEATLRLGNIRAAADELGVTSAAVGQRIRALEDYIGAPLFHRHPSGVEPSAALRAAAEPLARGMGHLADAFAQITAGETARVAVSMLPSFAENWVSRELGSFFAQMPGVELRIDTSKALVDLRSGNFDFAVRQTAKPDPGLEGIRLVPGGLVPVCTPDFAERYGLSPDNWRLHGFPFCEIGHGSSDPDFVDWPGWCARFGRVFPEDQIPHIVRFNSGLRASRGDLGLILGGLIESLPMLQEGALVMPFGPESAVHSKYGHWLVWAEGRRRTPTQLAFRDWIVERATEAHRSLAELFPDLPREPDHAVVRA